MQKITLLVLLAFLGCGRNSPPSIPPTIGDFVANDDGVGTAKIFGIDFQVHVKSSGTTTDDSIEASFLEPERSTARKRLTLGDDITIQLDSVDESTVRFMFNEQNYGTLKTGDKVLINDARNVEVNGTKRLPDSAE